MICSQVGLGAKPNVLIMGHVTQARYVTSLNLFLHLQSEAMILTHASGHEIYIDLSCAWT